MACNVSVTAQQDDFERGFMAPVLSAIAKPSGVGVPALVSHNVTANVNLEQLGTLTVAASVQPSWLDSAGVCGGGGNMSHGSVLHSCLTRSGALELK